MTPPPAGDESYLQCPQCSAVYQIDADELEGPSRVVACSACLHEWYASEDSLLWGDELALQALVASSTSSFPTVQSRRSAPSTSETDAVQVDQTPSARKVANDSNDFVTARKQETPSQQRKKDVGPDSVSKIPTRGPRRQQVINKDVDDEDEYKSEDDMDAAEDGKKSHSKNRRSRVNPIANEKDLRSQTNSKGQNYNSRTASDRTEKTAAKKLPEDGAEGEFAAGELEKEEPVFSIFVGNLSFRATEEDLYRAFSGYGLVVKCQVPCDSGGASKGYGFVEMRTRESGLKAIESLQGASVLGRDISLTEARHKSFTTRRVYRYNTDTPDGRRRRNSGDRREQGNRYRDGRKATGQYDSRR